MAKYDTAWFNESTGEIFSPRGRGVYLNLLEARVNRKFPNNPPKFSGSLLIPKAANIDAIRKGIADVAEAKFGKDWKKKIKADKFPLQKTVDVEKLAEYAEAFPLILKTSASAEFPPVIIGPNGKVCTPDAKEIYGGRWVVIAGNAWAYDTGSNGIGWNLNRIQLLENDDPIAGGRVATAAGFEPIEVANSKVENASDVFGGDLNDDLPI